MKRSRGGGSVTGGTGDIKPQIFTVNGTAAGAVDDYAVNAINLPVPRFGTMRTKATIFEILQVHWYLTTDLVQNADTVNFALLTTRTSRTDGETSTLATLREDIDDPVSFAPVVHTAGLDTNGAARSVMPITIDLTDNNGNGFLVATDRIFAVSGGIGNNAAVHWFAKVLYRMVNVGVNEYIGIVQSQQA